ncbi:MAG: response regulator [Candidatus Omnitrophica bacterium]|nr:response regulator [Candidatus Omnitrophota bacterium]
MKEPKKTVLLIDDDIDFLESTEDTLQEAGFRIRGCSDPTKALLTIQELHPDCVILDILMPGLDGEDLLLMIRGKYAELPILVCSGAPHVDVPALLKSGASEVLRKPFTETALLTALDQMISDEKEAVSLVVKGFNLYDIRTTVTRKVIIKALAKTHFNLPKAALLLGIAQKRLQRYIKQLKISF